MELTTFKSERTGALVNFITPKAATDTITGMPTADMKWVIHRDTNDDTFVHGYARCKKDADAIVKILMMGEDSRCELVNLKRGKRRQLPRHCFDYYSAERRILPPKRKPKKCASPTSSPSSTASTARKR